MFGTITAYRSLIRSKKIFLILVVLSVLINILTSVFVYAINEKIQDALLSILSIIFPLIAGFMTFGRDTLKNIREDIKKIKLDELNDEGNPVTDIDKHKLRILKDLSSNFIKVVISTFVVSFILIVVLLVTKFNNFEFVTEKSFNHWTIDLQANLIILSLKIIFFSFIFIMFLNLLYSTYFIIQVTKHDDVIN